MITPRFEISQDESFIHLKIKIPYIRVSDLDVHAEGSTIKLCAMPYFLRLNLPHLVVEDNRSNAEYDYDAGVLKIRVAKMQQGQVFPNLDMVTTLLASQESGKPAIEVLGQVDQPPNEEEEINWDFPQEFPSVSINPEIRYGFNESHQGIFGGVTTGLEGVVESPSPDNLNPFARRQQRVMAEDARFDDEHFMCDLAEPELVTDALTFSPWYLDANSPPLTFEGWEQDALVKLPRKEYVIMEPVREWLRVVDVLFGYCYDLRTTLGDKSCESSWTITTLTCTLSWLDSFTNLCDLQLSLFHRALAYPLHRRLDLCQRVWDDVVAVVKAGKMTVLKCLLDVRRTLEVSDRYLLNLAVVNDMCSWFQQTTDAPRESLCVELERVKADKSQFRWPIAELEEEVKSLLE